MNINNPLVSIIVITYNSSKYVLEALESAKNQTYQNIELIISDDGSKDNTVEICNRWSKENQERFVRTEIIAVEKNTGIPANCNRGLRAAKGEWVKYIAGDDAFLNVCIEVNVKHIIENPEIKVLQTKSDFFNKSFLVENLLGTLPISKYVYLFDQGNIEQNKALFRKNFVSAPSIFMNKKLILSVGGFDEDFKLFEDITLWLNITKSGEKIHFLNLPTINYRRHEEIAERGSKPHMSQNYAKETLRFRKKYLNKESSFLLKVKYIVRLRLIIALDIFGFNNKSLLSSWIYKGVNFIFR